MPSLHDAAQWQLLAQLSIKYSPVPIRRYTTRARARPHTCTHTHDRARSGATLPKRASILCHSLALRTVQRVGGVHARVRQVPPGLGLQRSARPVRWRVRARGRAAAHARRLDDDAEPAPQPVRQPCAIRPSRCVLFALRGWAGWVDGGRCRYVMFLHEIQKAVDGAAAAKAAETIALMQATRRTALLSDRSPLERMRA